MRYIPKQNESRARALVDFDACGNISRTGSVIGMQRIYGWSKRGQVRIGAWIYNIGPENVDLLKLSGLVRG